MCGRYALALRPSQVRAMLQDENMPVYDAPDDDGQGAPRQSYNFAPGYHGIVYRADVPDWGAGPARDALVAAERGTTDKSPKGSSAGNKTKHTDTDVTKKRDQHDDTTPHYILQPMKWGLIPFWTKRNPDYGAVMKTINCRDDSLSTTGGMWSTMKARKRCLVVAQGFYEWLKPHNNPKEKIPHYIKRKDGKLMLLAGLWDCVVYDQPQQSSQNAENDEKNYTYTIITTDSNKQLKFLHDRMPVIFDPGSEEVTTWLDPKRYEWSPELQSLLKPWSGELEVYPVSKEVGKVGNNSPSFIIPVASKENKQNIANFFAAGAKSKAKKEESKDVEVRTEVKDDEGQDEKKSETKMESVDELQESVDDGGMFSPSPTKKGVKRERDASPRLDSSQKGGVTPTPKKIKMEASPSASPSLSQQGKSQQRQTISATKNPQRASPAKKKTKGAPPPGSQKITKFFGNSA
ncbi:putative ACR, COG2135 domain containing protein [Rhypophila decipiens]